MKNYTFIFLVFLLIGPAAICAATVPAQAIEVREGQVTTLTGSLDRTWGFGRPNFGEEPETDQIEPYIRLRLKTGITVMTFDSVLTPGINRIQLIFNKRNSVEWKRANGAIESGQVTVKGVLRLAVGGHHHETAVLEVESISITR